MFTVNFWPMTCFDFLVNDSNSHMWRVLFWVVCGCVFFIFSADVSAERQSQASWRQPCGNSCHFTQSKISSANPLSFPYPTSISKVEFHLERKLLPKGKMLLKSRNKDLVPLSCLIVGSIICFEFEGIFDFVLSPAVSWDQLIKHILNDWGWQFNCQF